MTINSWFYDSVNGDRPYSAVEFAKAFGVICDTGIISEAGTMGFPLSSGAVPYNTIGAGRAVIEGHFVQVTGTELLTIPTGSFTGQIVIRVDFSSGRTASLIVKTDQNPQQDDTMFELPLYNVTVSNGTITATTDLRSQGGAVATLPSNAVTWNSDPNGVIVNTGLMAGNGKPIRLFLTSAQPAASSTEIRAWIQIDKF